MSNAVSTSAFSERLALLRREAGQPTYESIERGVRLDIDPTSLDPRGRPVRAPSYQRISAWANGENVPSSWPQCELVLRHLIERARRTHPRPVVEGLYGLAAWEALWRTARKGSAEQRAAAEACPYRGLEAFQADHAAYFFGRARATEELLTRLRDTAPGSGPLMLVAPSGAGKSSLLRAGLLPAVRDGALGATSWRTLVHTPGAQPVAELTGRVGEPEPGTRLLLVVDQFEELFTLCDDEAQRREYLELLHRLCTEPDGAATLVVAVRADFYARCLDHPRIAEALQARQMLLAPMTGDELAEAVTGPAAAAGLRLEPGLVDLLLADAGVDRTAATGADPGILPLVSHALAATWERRRRGGLTIEGYRGIGGIASAVEATAERAWSELDAEGRRAGEGLLLMLTRIGGDGTQHTRARQDIQQLLRRCADRAGAEEALETLAGARLVTLDAEWAQFAHEVMLTAWPRLRALVEEHRETLLLRQRVEEDAEVWATQQRESSLLYRGARLETARQWAQHAELDGPGDTAREFLAVSARQHRRQRWTVRAGIALVVVLALVAGSAAVLARAQRDDALYDTVLAQADRLRDSDPSTSAQLDLVAHRMRPDDRAVDGRLLSTQNLPLASTLPGGRGAVWGTAFSPDGRTLATINEFGVLRLWDVADPTRISPLGRPLSVGTGGLGSWVAFSPDGHTLAGVDSRGSIALWDLGDRAHPVPLGPPLPSEGSVNAVAFSPDGRTLAAVGKRPGPGGRGQVTMWSVADRAHPVVVATLPATDAGSLAAVAYSRTGALLAAAGLDGAVHLWNVAVPARAVPVGAPFADQTGAVYALAFSPDGRTLATGGQDKRARLWSLADPAHPVLVGIPLDAGADRVNTVEFSSDGRLLLAASNDGVARIWEVEDPAHPQRIYGDLSSSNSGIQSAAFAPDGHAVVTGRVDGSTTFWALPGQVLPGHSGGVLSLAYRPDGRVLAGGGPDGTVRLWDVANPTRPVAFGAPIAVDGPAYALAYGARGDLLAVTGQHGSGRLWNVHDPAHPVPLGSAAANTVNTHVIAVSPDGRVLAVGGDSPDPRDADDAIQLWDVADPTRPRALGPPLRGNHSYLLSVAFSSDGHLLGTTGQDGTVRLWDVRDPAAPKPLGPPLAPGAGAFGPLAFRPDGGVLAAAAETPRILAWSLTDPARPAALPPLTGHAGNIGSLAFSPDGRVLASGSVDHTTRVWDLSDPSAPAPVPRTLTAQAAAVEATAFAPDGRTLATGSDDDTVMLWDLDVNRSARRICATTQGALPESQWHQLLPQLRYDPPC